jgi:hypothetical protein
MEVKLKSKPQHIGRRAACVIAQQYSSATFISLWFHSRKEKFGARLKKKCLIISMFLLPESRLNVKLHYNFGFYKSGSVRIWNINPCLN